MVCFLCVRIESTDLYLLPGDFLTGVCGSAALFHFSNFLLFQIHVNVDVNGQAECFILLISKI